MKLKYLIAAAFVVLGLSMASCEYDNYDAPSYLFSGQLKCDGEDYPFDANKSPFKLYQRGYGKADGGGTDMRVDESGHYQQLFFDAEYKLTLLNRSFPYEFPEFKSLGAGKGYDSITYHFNSNVTKDFEIRPYYKLKNLRTELKNGNIVATFNIEKMTNTVMAAPKIAKVRIYLGTSKLVNSGIPCNLQNDVEYIDDTTLETSIPLSMYRDKRYYPNNFRTYAFCRVALELEGMNEFFLFSEIQKIENLPVN